MLRTARVLVIDDEPSQAMPVIKALGLLGIGCVYVQGDRVSELNKFKELRGIRLAFIDMRLGTYGSSKEAVPVTVNVIKRVIDRDFAPALIVAWTQHREDVDLFKTMLSSEIPGFSPVYVRLMEKPFEGDLINATRTRRALIRILRKVWPLGVLWNWEQMSHDATTNTTLAISKVVSERSQEQNATKWNTTLVEILRLLMAAGAGQSEKPRDVSRGLLEVLNHIHFDGLIHTSDLQLRKHSARLVRIKPPKLSVPESATLGTLLGLSKVDGKDCSVRPGNLYIPRRQFGIHCPHRRCKPDMMSLMEDVLNLRDDAKYKEFEDKLKMKQNHRQNVQQAFRRLLTRRRKELAKQCKSVLLEVSPNCDYSQNTRKVSRFVAGLLVPQSLSSLIKGKKESSKRLDPVIIPCLSGVWHPVFSARFPYTIGKPERSVKSAPVARLRSNILVDVQAWLAAQSARPGYLSAS